MDEANAGARVAGRRFDGRRALVTGASRGIGAAVAERLGAEGASVAIVARTLDLHDHLPGSLAESRARIESHGADATVVVADLTDEDQRSRVVDEASDGLGGPIDILVNNAAAAIYTEIATMPLKRRRLMFEANVHAPIDLAQSVIPSMVESGAGWIVNLTSGSADAWDGPPFELGVTGSAITLYGSSKAALRRLSNGLAAELYGTGIRVNAVEPRAAVLSEGAEELVGGKLRADQIESMEHMVEGVLGLCDCAEGVTGRTWVSGDVVSELGLDVHALDGSPMGDGE
ncbi:MAG: SDR family NAD(P)-dependent oxidoreductase [Microthrixaceae bacterium]